MTAELNASQLADLVRKVQAGNEVIVMDKNQVVARLVPARAEPKADASGFKMRTFADREVLTPKVSQSELAEEMFGGE